MKSRRPNKGAALGNKRLESGIGARTLDAGFKARNPFVAMVPLVRRAMLGDAAGDPL